MEGEEQEPDDNWAQNIINQIRELKKIVNGKVEKTVVDQIARYQDEILNLKKTNSESFGILENRTSDPETICHDCIENDDMESAFFTVLKYIETVSNTKAEASLVEKKASIQYVDSLFNRLNVITRQQITEANTMLKEQLETRLNSLIEDFDSYAEVVEKRVRYCESEIVKLEDTIENSRLITKKPLETYKKPVKILTEKQKPVHRTLHNHIPTLQPMRSLVTKGETNPDFLLTSTKIFD